MMKLLLALCCILIVCVQTKGQADVNDCIGVTCSGNGVCDDGINSFSCNCSAGFTGRLCEINIDECLSNPCGINGICVDGLNTFLCICNPGYTGILCQRRVNNNPSQCSGVTCSGNGRCVELPIVNSFDCICDPGFTGRLCNVVNINDCTFNPCINGECLVNDATGTSQCVCDPGFTGDRCQTNIDDCIGVNCSGNGVCVDGNNSFSCDCNAGFEGRLCNVFNLDDCASNPCGLNGQCLDGLNNYTCQCSPGYSGPQCAQVDRFQINNLLGPLIGGSVGALLLVIFTLTCIAAVGVSLMRCGRQRTEDRNSFFQ